MVHYPSTISSQNYSLWGISPGGIRLRDYKMSDNTKIVIDRVKLLDGMGRPRTQSLFLENGYGEDAVYTLKDFDYEYKGKLYPSIKRLYLEEEDPTEYTFATKYFLSWRHWLRIYENKLMRHHIDEWREELELMVRAQAYKDMVALCASENGNFSAAKWLAEKGWDKRQPGRPTKNEAMKERALLDRISSEYEDDAVRLKVVGSND